MGADTVLDLDAHDDRRNGARRCSTRPTAKARTSCSKPPAPPPPIPEGLDLARVGGRYVIAGHYTDVGRRSVNAHQQINRKHLEIRGCWGSEARHFLRALSILERHPVDSVSAGSARAATASHQLNEALADAEAMRIPKALVDPWQ